MTTDSVQTSLQAMLRTLFERAVKLCDEAAEIVEPDVIDMARSASITGYFNTIELLRDPESSKSVIAMYAADVSRAGSGYDTADPPLIHIGKMLEELETEKIDAAIAIISTLHESIWGDGICPKLN